mmetsp:Transcript_77297/g.165729  ORF Transcript_77297/g.165729 Transcript_77297/m.165729 type:complete len:200 (-) Transcript_77297:109-708(-)
MASALSFPKAPLKKAWASSLVIALLPSPSIMLKTFSILSQAACESLCTLGRCGNWLPWLMTPCNASALFGCFNDIVPDFRNNGCPCFCFAGVSLCAWHIIGEAFSALVSRFCKICEATTPSVFACPIIGDASSLIPCRCCVGCETASPLLQVCDVICEATSPSLGEGHFKGGVSAHCPRWITPTVEWQLLLPFGSLEAT